MKHPLIVLVLICTFTSLHAEEKVPQLEIPKEELGTWAQIQAEKKASEEVKKETAWEELQRGYKMLFGGEGLFL